MKETSETLAERQLVSSPQQYSCTHDTLHPEVSHKTTRMHWFHSQLTSLQQTLHVP